MSLTDWNVFKDGGSLSENIQGNVYTEIITPIDGTGSVLFTTTPSNDFQSMNVIPSIISTGYRSGRVRSLLRFKQGSPASSSFLNYAGILCMQSVTDMAKFGVFGGTGQGYGMAVIIGNSFTLQEVRLLKFTSGLDGSSGNLTPYSLSSVPLPFVLSANSVMCIELVWRTDQATLDDVGGGYFSLRVGQQQNFSDLTQVISYVDSISVYTGTVGEGLWVGMKGLSSQTSNLIAFDDTYVYRTSIT